MFALCGAFLAACAFLQQALLRLASPEPGGAPATGGGGGGSKEQQLLLMLPGGSSDGGAAGVADSGELILDLGRRLGEQGGGAAAGAAEAKGTALRPLPSKRPAAL
jgi:hypothetical protein